MTRLQGGGPSGISICGFLVRSVLPLAWATGACDVQAAGAAGPATAGADAEASGLLPAVDALPASLLPPQPASATVSAVASATAARLRLTSWPSAAARAACPAAA